MYLGDFLEDSTVRISFTTNDKSGGAVAPSTAFENDDVKIYKNGSATEKATVNGVTMTSPFDSVTGLHLLAIDTSVDTGDAGFWVTGADYIVVLSPDETVDSETVVSVIGSFSIENRSLEKVSKLQRADKIVDTAGATWVVDYKEEGTETIIMSKTMKDESGNNITNTDSVLGQLEQE